MSAIGAYPLPRRQVHRERMALVGHIAKDTLLGPERPAARAIDRDQSDRGRSSGRAAIPQQIRRRIQGRSRNHASITRKTLAPREPSIHEHQSGNWSTGPIPALAHSHRHATSGPRCRTSPDISGIMVNATSCTTSWDAITNRPDRLNCHRFRLGQNTCRGDPRPTYANRIIGSNLKDAFLSLRSCDLTIHGNKLVPAPHFCGGGVAPGDCFSNDQIRHV